MAFPQIPIGLILVYALPDIMGHQGLAENIIKYMIRKYKNT
jgi:hypothetical protein